MKILHTTESYYPSIGGVQEVVRRISEAMVKQGHDITVATSKRPDRTSHEHNGVKIVDFDVSGNAVHGINGDKAGYQAFLQDNNFDIIMNYAAQQWTADAFFEVIDKVHAKKVLVPCGYSAMYDPAYADYFKALPATLKKYDATIYLANEYRDIDFARKHGLKNIHIIPNGADANEFDEFSRLESDVFKATHGIGGLMIATLGNHTGEKGHFETIRAFKFSPIGNSTLVIIGGGNKNEGCWQLCQEQAKKVNDGWKFHGKRIVLVDGENRAETVSALKAADIFMFLSNIECSPLALFEAVAAKTPFIATSAGNNAEIAQWTQAGIIVKSHPRDNGRVRADLFDSVRKLTHLAYSKKRRQKMSVDGYINWQKKFTWQQLSEQYMELYEQLVTNEKSRKKK